MAEPIYNGAWKEFSKLQDERFGNLERVLQEGFDKLDNRLMEMASGMMQIISGKDVISTDTAKDLLDQQAKSYQRILVVVSSLMGAIVLVVVGLKVIAPQVFH